MSKEEKERKTVICCVKNCHKEIPIDNAIIVGDKYFCGVCGTAYVRSALNL